MLDEGRARRGRFIRGNVRWNAELAWRPWKAARNIVNPDTGNVTVVRHRQGGAMAFELDGERIAEENRKRLKWLEEDFEHLGRQLTRRGVDIERLTERAAAFRVSVPSWGLGTGGTRFARFAVPGEPRNVFEKIEDCEVVFKLVRTTPGISLHIPWDQPESPAELRSFAEARGLFFDSMNSNTFQDQPRQALSYKFGSLSHTDSAVRRQAVEHNLECLRLGVKLGARSHTVWIGDGGNFPGQVHLRKTLERCLDSVREIYRALPEGWRLFIEHKLYEPAFYSTVLNDWGTSYHCVRELARAYVQAHLVDRARLAEHQEGNDALLALQTLKQAFNTDVEPILAMARYRAGGAIDPVGVYRSSGYRQRAAQARPASARLGAGIV